MANNSTTGLLLVLAALFLLQRKAGRENEETWEVKRDANGRLIGITVHRELKSS